MTSDNSQFSVYGSTGFIGSCWMNLYPSFAIERDSTEHNPGSDEVLYFISTTDNYNIFTDPHKDVNTNLTKLIDVLESCKKSDKKPVFNFVSSWFVYGLGASLDTKEEDSCDPTGFYSITKRAAEQLIICYCRTFGMQYRIFRMTNIIGPGDKGVSPKKNALQHMMNLLGKGEPLNLYDGGSNVRDFMPVKDACRAIKLCIEKAPVNEIINITNKQPITVGEVINYSKNKMQSSSTISYIEAPDFHKIVQIKNVCLNNDKLLSYGYVPKTTTFEAVDEIIKNIEVG